ncbi:FABP family protein [Salinibacterium hongtaonis]|uniref:Peroxynitrite isomerase n=1 Tax=Homoserinimonas hongtaonis TaxID=2079791 RepID=A0A2U1T2S1_9MICO|nr:FABP family protein [Salinibacterium hongtaonis]PWB98166.1 FABP family protein [Salinibacterium hongtaonis]
MIEIDSSLPSELVPLSWLIGVWEGTGVISYPVDGQAREYEFGQRVSFSHDGTPFLNYSSTAWLLEPSAADAASDASSDGSADGSADADAASEPAEPQIFAAETGFWRLSRPRTDADPGPGMLPGVGPAPFTNVNAVETLRNAAGGFDIEVSILHPSGVSELYLGQVVGPRIDLVTDAVVRSANAKEHTASTRLYGLVDDHLLWAWDIVALGQPLTSHASARLARVQ